MWATYLLYYKQTSLGLYLKHNFIIFRKEAAASHAIGASALHITYHSFSLLQGLSKYRDVISISS